MADLTLHVTDTPDPADLAVVSEGLAAFNESDVGPSGRRTLAVVLRDGAGAVRGGLSGYTAWGWLYVQWLWLAEGWRGQGLAARLLSAAEAEARARGCHGAWIDTFSPHALHAYARAGYAPFGRLDDFPRGRARTFLQKPLGPSRPGGLTRMAQEIAEIPAAAARFLTDNAARLADIGAALRGRDPALVATVARGSSDHAASYLKYAVEIAAGVPVASLGPSVASVYGRPLRLGGAACIAISQSGASPDILAMMQAARAAGALGIAVTNTPAAPLAGAADHTLPLLAGVESSVAATKTLVASVLAGLALLAAWQDDAALRAALAALPETLERARAQDWSALGDRLLTANSAFVLGRGPGHAIAAEMALKLKETCALHAEAYSAAEVLHGPAAIVRAGFPVLALAVQDAARESVLATVERLAGQGADVFVTGFDVPGARRLPLPPPLHPLVDPLVAVVAFYGMVEGLARRRGHDPDAPFALNKVTLTR